MLRIAQSRNSWPAACCCLAAAFLVATGVRAETGERAWLRYASIHDQAALSRYRSLPAVVVAIESGEVVRTAQHELVRGVRGMLGRTLREQTALPGENAIVLGTVARLRASYPAFHPDESLRPDAYVVKTIHRGGHTDLLITAVNPRGVLYGAFAVLRTIALGQALADETVQPAAPLRWVDQWDNLNGTIERGYGGPSIFFAGGHVVQHLGRAREFARLLASVGINACVVNNVNADARLLTPAYLAEVARIARVFRPFGVQLGLAVDLSSPKLIGGLNTFDPLDPRVARWWRDEAAALYRAIPDFAGVVVKADSEGRAGPSAYGRTHADAANVIARALKPFGGVVFYRAFVYNHRLDWRNLKNDRARAAYDNFHPLDGRFDSNVVIQIKNGPIDFQVREPASPLFSGLEKTNQAIELEITQEYTGQQRHLCFLVPMWKQVLDFDMHARGPGTPVKDLVAGRTFHRPLGGFVGVSNVGSDPDWMGSNLAQANLYGFARLAWDPNLSARRIAAEWTRQTFGPDPLVAATVPAMLLSSWRIYEDYTGPLGLGTLTDILGAHYGPGIASAERNGWGQWIRADHEGVGMDRTVATGTGYIGQYSPAVAKVYESLKTCPDALLLFMHHVAYTYRLHSGGTVIQYIYNSHYRGAAAAEGLLRQWRSLEGRIDEARYRAVLARLEYQAGHARVWRDAVCSWFLRMSGIPDAHGRAGHFPNRVEAESMKLEGYRVAEVTPWETASGGKAVECAREAEPCTAAFQFNGKPGWYNLGVEYFDQNNGVSRFRVFVGQQCIDHWLADADLPSRRPDGSSSTRRLITGVALRPGDEMRVEGTPQGDEPAPLDYVEVTPSAQP
jgi:alpha-glucuronidase